MVSSGIMLQLKKQSNWIQPNVEVTSSSKPIMLQLILMLYQLLKKPIFYPGMILKESILDLIKE